MDVCVKDLALVEWSRLFGNVSPLIGNDRFQSKLELYNRLFLFHQV